MKKKKPLTNTCFKDCCEDTENQTNFRNQLYVHIVLGLVDIMVPSGLIQSQEKQSHLFCHENYDNLHIIIDFLSTVIKYQVQRDIDPNLHIIRTDAIREK